MTPEHMGIHAINFSAANNSPSRSVMMANHFAQKLTLDHPDEKIIQSGPEQELSKTTFSVKMPENGKIIKVIHRYPKGIDQNSMRFNPETLVIYEKDSNKEIDYFLIPYHASFHQYFGFKYSQKDEISKIKPGAFIGKDTIFADSPAVSENMGYRYGLNLNVAMMSHPAVSEDGIVVSRDVLERFKFRVYEKRSVEFGSNMFPLNLYGKPDDYKAFQEIGEYIRDDGVLMMLRSYDSEAAPVEMSIYDVMEPDFVFDKAVYVRGGVGRIVDVKVYGNNVLNRKLPPGMTDQLERYRSALVRYHQEIIQTETELRQGHKKKFGEDSLRISPKLHQLIVRSHAILGTPIRDNKTGKNTKQLLNLLYRKNPIDEYRVEFVIEYEMIPDIGYKLTGLHGDKGVICKIEEPENMPIRPDGLRADAIMDGASTAHRMNLGRLYEHYFAGAAQDITRRIRERILGHPEPPRSPVTIDKVLELDPKVFEETYQYLIGLYQCINDYQYEFFANLSHEEKAEHLADVLNDIIYLYYPVDNQKEIDKVVMEVEQKYQPLRTPVKYIGDSKLPSVTTEKVRIAPLYVMLLEKIADDGSAVSSAKLQHFGILSPQTKSEKFSYPYRNSPVRTIDETGGRIMAGYTGAESIAEMMDRSNSPITRRLLYGSIMEADKPTNIKQAVNRELHPLGSSRPLQLIRSVLFCAGLQPVYEEESSDVTDL